MGTMWLCISAVRCTDRIGHASQPVRLHGRTQHECTPRSRPQVLIRASGEFRPHCRRSSRLTHEGAHEQGKSVVVGLFSLVVVTCPRVRIAMGHVVGVGLQC
jgi:hypothetical protein